MSTIEEDLDYWFSRVKDDVMENAYKLEETIEDRDQEIQELGRELDKCEETISDLTEQLEQAKETIRLATVKKDEDELKKMDK